MANDKDIALKELAEREIIEKERVVDYNTKEYPVEIVVQKYLTGIETDENELYIPDYQRDFSWDLKRQSKFIESVMIGLPVPYIFVADTEKSDGRLEIVDGSQRIRTLAAFLQDELRLVGLEKLQALNDFTFSELLLSRQRRFGRRTMRMIELTNKADEEVRRDIFERINTGSDILKDMEVRRGVNDGPLIDLLEECASIPLFKSLAPLSETSEKRREREEFVLRFFAYLDGYQTFERSVRDFLNEWIKNTEKTFDDTLKQNMLDEFNRMLTFVSNYFPHGFVKSSKHSRTPRIRFEAIAVGVALALRENPNLNPASVNWLASREFKELVTSDASNSRPKVIRRIEFVRDKLIAS
ncbi:Protein of unknown function DUF262 [Dyadobacter sp. SG02]|uniref:DUF262 domain-containing protein n=1 Tax=Dyadobacter sp. SG02 TaxID=1855291 RepID=UPI0008D6CA99|nr:DUF262 domain-containing protein [Dyadobacter sp. SG02]SEJ75015.1 Protein of unknown function DUF262 [Dyadobacter sp. SG02]